MASAVTENYEAQSLVSTLVQLSEWVDMVYYHWLSGAIVRVSNLLQTDRSYIGKTYARKVLGYALWLSDIQKVEQVLEVV